MAILLIISLIPACVIVWSGFVKEPVPAIGEHEVFLENVSKLEGEPLWIDARAREKYEAGSIPAALWLEPGSWEEGIVAVMERWQPGSPILVFCDGGWCRTSHEVADRLRDEYGLEPVFVLWGGYPAWEEAQP